MYLFRRVVFRNFRNHFFPIVVSLLLCGIFFSPMTASQTWAVTTFAVDAISLIAILQNIVDALIPFLIGLAVMLIVYGILGYISKTADEEKRTEAKNFILWGIFGIFIMVSVWGLVNILFYTFNLDTSNTVVTDIYKPKVISTEAPTTLVELIDRVNSIGSYVIPFLIGIGVFIVLLGIVNYIRQGDNEEKRAEGRMFIIWGVISIFIMLSIWGLVNILVKSFNFDNSVTSTTIPDLPTLPVPPPKEK